MKSIPSEDVLVRERYARRPSDDGRYSWFNPGHLFLMQHLERQVLALLARSGCLPIQGKRILEIGCGTGYWLREFLKMGAPPENLIGVDLLSTRLAEARKLCPEGVKLVCGSASTLGFQDSFFDLVLQSTVFTSILNSEARRQVAAEMLRVLKPNGLILWYDFHVDNPSNPDVAGVKRREVLALFSGCQLQLRRITLAPPIARWVARRSWLGCHLLEKIPWLCTHYLGVIQK